MINKHIEIVSSTVIGLSSMGKVSRDAILAVLAKHYSHVRVTIINDLSDLEALTARKPDLVVLGMKFIPSNPQLRFQNSSRIWISEYLDMHDIAYTGSRQPAHELELDKPLAKQRALNFGLKTTPFYVARQNKSFDIGQLPLEYPLFVKPTDRGGGLGIDSSSVAYNFEQVQSKVQSITANHRSDSLIENYLPGREISVAILKNDITHEYTVMPIERIVPPNKHGVSILSPDVKHADSGLSVAVTDADVKKKVSQLAIDVFYALGARDYGRIDTRMDANGIPHFLEANLIPSLIEGYGNFPKACMLNLNLDYEQMLLRIVRLAFSRNADSISSSPFEYHFATPLANTALQV
ncbi:D-alanine--D-alanine ligase [Candidatus Saccharibacteria bacterium]|nr:D-alanine--D-alanine ligase [Candidatus Saccharibacteria bacterium]